ncbi:SIR2 family NAD-dependent protein deacylase [Lichenibacterium dinghuense]|uniref:SIR2 family NAD-dependent protein deacylase n=1 Tax=Lichenibacterium dinghuense TaxID=2895977 RepID=UPI001F47746B|nr:Sir2 family NAD-dependent protein deacetylase [Lichenibacterium sp. 6Y81]
MTAAHHSAALARLLGRASAVTVFTGAGISTECGVPDYRSPGSPWRVHAPIGFAAFLADPAMRAEAWRRKWAMDDLYAGARPGRGHRAVARWAASGLVRAVVTQNIDGLHGAAAGPGDEIVELHGNGSYARCLGCGTRHELAPIRARFERDGSLPHCSCGGIVKSASVAFGQSLDPADLGRAVDASLGCDLFLVLGSTLLVRPAARFPELARRNGARLAIVNREATPLDGEADLVLRADIGDVLDPL